MRGLSLVRALQVPPCQGHRRSGQFQRERLPDPHKRWSVKRGIALRASSPLQHCSRRALAKRERNSAGAELLSRLPRAFERVERGWLRNSVTVAPKGGKAGQTGKAGQKRWVVALGDRILGKFKPAHPWLARPMSLAFEIDRFDYVSGSWLFWSENHTGQGSEGYARLSRYQFNPGACFTGWPSPVSYTHLTLPTKA